MPKILLATGIHSTRYNINHHHR